MFCYLFFIEIGANTMSTENVAGRGPTASWLVQAGLYLRIALKFITGAGLLTVIYIYCQRFWYDKFVVIFGPSMAKLGLTYTYGKGLTPPAQTLDMYDSMYTLLFWVPLGGGALFMILANRLSNEAKPEWLRKSQLLVRGLAAGVEEGGLRWGGIRLKL